ncbi:MAG TPA: hypothetical protein VM115_13740 [Vicinamibacterales bacterium]|nr:hypothetical protein [Vicinamibacterales bacterium]
MSRSRQVRVVTGLAESLSGNRGHRLLEPEGIQALRSLHGICRRALVGS